MTVLLEHRKAFGLTTDAPITVLFLSVSLLSGPLTAQDHVVSQWHMTNSNVSVDMTRHVKPCKWW